MLRHKVYPTNWKTIYILLVTGGVLVVLAFTRVSASVNRNAEPSGIGPTTANPTLPRADQPRGIAITPDGKTLYVTANKSHNVFVVDVANREVVDVIDPTAGGAVEAVVEDIAITPDGSWGVVTNPVPRDTLTGTVNLLDLQTHQIAKTLTFPGSSVSQPRVAPDSQTAYVAGMWPPRIFVVDMPSQSVTATVSLNAPDVNLWSCVIALSPDGETLYAVGPYGLPTGDPSGYSRLVLVDTTILTITQVIDLDIADAVNFSQAAVSPDGTELYVVWGEQQQVIVLDLLNNGAKIATIEFPQETLDLPAITFSPDGARAYVSGYTPGGMFIVDTETHTVIEHIIDAAGYAFSDLHALAMAPDGGTVYIAGSNHDDVFALDTTTHNLGTFIDLNPIQLWPQRMALSSDGRWLYVDGIAVGPSAPSGVHVVDTASLDVVEHIPLQSPLIAGSELCSFHGLALSPDDTRLYTHARARSQADPDHMLSLVLDLATQQIVGVINLGVVQTDVGDKVIVAADGSHVYYTFTAEQRLVIADTNTLSVVAEISLSIEPIDIALNGTGKLAFISGGETGTHWVSHLTVVDLESSTVLTTVAGTTDYPPPCPGLGLSPNDSTVWLGSNNRVELIDTATMTITEDIDLLSHLDGGDFAAACPYGITFSPDGAKVHIANYDSNTYMLFDAATRSLEYKLDIGFAPAQVLVSPAGGRAYVLNSDSESLSVIDVDAGEVITTIFLAYPWLVYLPLILK